jgi:hypothetical protein
VYSDDNQPLAAPSTGRSATNLADEFNYWQQKGNPELG